VDQIVNWDVLQTMLNDQHSRLNPVQEIVYAAGGRLMEIAWERSFTPPWRIDACKTTDEPIYSLELVGTSDELRSRVLFDGEKHLEFPLTVMLRDKDGRTARLTVKPPSESRPE